ncbi:hypothetical protein GCM10010211_71790 [Streptomyces albospinus]|uniref:Uncharacterized protein n=1 Tax=Streptomyces albospinus TaxID=285515 RepID=A0ABQ2VKY9_9ACTN|nr:hypothetical protein GCM10010211_71790 [Streptomyces albospinus]
MTESGCEAITEPCRPMPSCAGPARRVAPGHASAPWAFGGTGDWGLGTRHSGLGTGRQRRVAVGRSDVAGYQAVKGDELPAQTRAAFLAALRP